MIANAIGIAGSLASGIIEYLADGSSTKRLHAGAAAQSGLRAALLAQGRFTGPLSVLEGTHGFYRAFAPSRAPDFELLIRGLGTEWVMEGLAFKPYACGTMTQPFIDCAIALAASGVRADEIVAIECEVGEGTVHRLWEPLALKQAPPNGYAGKFSTPYCIAVGFLDGKAGFAQFTDERSRDSAVRDLAAKISYIVDPANPYPRNFTGHVRARLKTARSANSTKITCGAAPRKNCRMPRSRRSSTIMFRFGGWSDTQARALADTVTLLSAGGVVDFSAARN